MTVLEKGKKIAASAAAAACHAELMKEIVVLTMSYMFFSMEWLNSEKYIEPRYL